MKQIRTLLLLASVCGLMLFGGLRLLNSTSVAVSATPDTPENSLPTAQAARSPEPAAPNHASMMDNSGIPQSTISPDTAGASSPHSPSINNKKLAELIDKHISPSMRLAINEKLKPGGKPPAVIQRGDTLILDTSDRAATVMVGFIDDEEGLVITDFTHPLPARSTP